MTSKREYLANLMRLMSPAEIVLSAAYPTKYMSRMHVALHYVALRRMGVTL